MKKTQKKLGNKGFSLVELIVVIAIMAVLVGVLAPTLIRNVEKSRESTDLQTLDSLRQSVTTALSTESVNNVLPSGGTSLTLSGGTLTGSTDAFKDAVTTELTNDGVINASMKSKSGQSGTITITISEQGKVTVAVMTTASESSASSVVKASRSNVDLKVE